ncbi:MAG: dockerin type I repeat-containing protein [Ruminococcus sp.]|nr:dockerin type I repeat-containing protein [Ruminococcus sp.]
MDSVKLVGNFASDRKKWLSKLWEPYKFVRGDVNADGLFDVADLVMMQKAVLGSGTLTDHTAGNLSNDGAIDCFDLTMMRKMLLSV